MKNFKISFGISVLFLLLITSCQEAKDQKDKAYVNVDASNLCLADAAWFQVDPTSGKRNTPAPQEDINSVFGNNATVTNCDFHRWSWQKFLWLTNDVAGKPFFMTNLIQVDNQTVVVPGGDKQIVLSSTDNMQATNDILRTNKTFSTNNTSYDVYYSIHVDSSLYKSIWKYAPMDENTYADSTFPVGALELKIAWVDARAIKDANSYFLTDALVNGTNTKIALLGMHVVGIVYNHPEFVWATFEHHDLAPYYNWTDTTTTSDIPVTSKTNKLLFNAADTATLANITNSDDASNIFIVNKYGVPRQPGNAYLLTSQAEPENYNNIESINISVQKQLTDVWNNYFYNGSLWINTEDYDYPTAQAQLLDSLAGNLGNAAPGTKLRGSVAAFNITMETYEQLGFGPTSIHGQTVKTLGNCFSCHSADRGTPLSISHIFNGAVDKSSGLTKKETKQKHLNEIKSFKSKMK